MSTDLVGSRTEKSAVSGSEYLRSNCLFGGCCFCCCCCFLSLSASHTRKSLFYWHCFFFFFGHFLSLARARVFFPSEEIEEHGNLRLMHNEDDSRTKENCLMWQCNRWYANEHEIVSWHERRSAAQTTSDNCILNTLDVCWSLIRFVTCSLESELICARQIHWQIGRKWEKESVDLLKIGPICLLHDAIEVQRVLYSIGGSHRQISGFFIFIQSTNVVCDYSSWWPRENDE